MIQELFGEGSAPTGLLGERKISSIPFPPSSSSPTCPSTTPILTTPPTTTTTAPFNSSNSTGANPNNNNSETTQNLRCPRCDSTNTKFCYYNNYNLTQPRHFCKTCRRYWTKGGTLRNVPIGGGCRKNKSSAPGGGSSATSGLQKSSSNAMAKAKATLSTELLVNGNSGFLGNGFLDPLHHHHSELQPGSSPIFWPSLPQAPNSHILALLRGTTPFPPNPNNPNNPNPNPNSSPLSAAFASLKTESITTSPGGLDSYGNGAPSMVGSFSRSNQNQLDGFGLGGGQDFVQNGGNNTSNILDLYQRLKSSSNYNYCGNEYPGMVILGNAVSPSSSSAMNATIFEASPVSGGDHNFGGYNFMSSPATSNWFDLPTVPINGAFP